MELRTDLENLPSKASARWAHGSDPLPNFPCKSSWKIDSRSGPKILAEEVLRRVLLILGVSHLDLSALQDGMPLGEKSTQDNPLHLKGKGIACLRETAKAKDQFHFPHPHTRLASNFARGKAQLMKSENRGKPAGGISGICLRAAFGRGQIIPVGLWTLFLGHTVDLSFGGKTKHNPGGRSCNLCGLRLFRGDFRLLWPRAGCLGRKFVGEVPLRERMSI